MSVNESLIADNERLCALVAELQAELDQRQWVSVDEASTQIITGWPDNDVVMLTEGRNPETIAAQFLMEVGASHYAVLPPPLPDNQEVSS